MTCTYCCEIRWNKSSKSSNNRILETLSHAGVSIFFTSFTDLMAFLITGFTLPFKSGQVFYLCRYWCCN